LPFVSELLNGEAVASGLSPRRAAVQRFTLQSDAESPPSDDPGQRKFSILLVEDNPADAGLVREALQEHGVRGELIVISDGEEAIRFITALDARQAPCPDLVIIDLNLPKSPGMEVLKRMRQSAKCGKATSLIFSSSDVESEKLEAQRLGASRYLRKPLRLEEFFRLGAVFREMLEGTGTPET
jgi:CheY-like chemotaxis protein